MLAGISIALPNGRGSDGKSRRFNEAIRATSVRRCERIARARARQAEPPAPPRQTLAFSRWRRRFRLRIDIFSRLLREWLDPRGFPYPTEYQWRSPCLVIPLPVQPYPPIPGIPVDDRAVVAGFPRAMAGRVSGRRQPGRE